MVIMKKQLSALLLAILTPLTTLTAQSTVTQTVDGSYEILKPDGTPPDPGANYYVVVMPISGSNDAHTVLTLVDQHDGNGPQVLTSETAILTPNAGGYLWATADGRTAQVTPLEGGDNETEVLRGRHPGLKRRWKRQ